MLTLLWDLDGTVLDFLAAEKAAIKSLFKEFGLGECTDEMIKKYSVINKQYWQKLEKGEMSKPDILRKRFEDFFALMGLSADAKAFNDKYQVRLGDTIVFIDEGDKLLRELKSMGYKQYAVTNGTRIAQRNKLSKSGLYDVFDDVFISDEIGHEKPTREFFDFVFNKIGEDERKKSIIIGDSLTSDIKGGQNAGIMTCYFNRLCEKYSLPSPVTLEISSLYEIKDALKSLGI